MFSQSKLIILVKLEEGEGGKREKVEKKIIRFKHNNPNTKHKDKILFYNDDDSCCLICSLELLE